MTITIRKAGESDASSVADLSTELGYPCAPHEMSSRVVRILVRTDHLLLVAESEENVCAWLQAHSVEIVEYGFRVEILGLVVSSRVRRKGVGRLLIARVEAWAVEIGATSIVVRSNNQRAESHLFYPALGYTLSKTQSVYRKMLVR